MTPPVPAELVEAPNVLTFPTERASPGGFQMTPSWATREAARTLSAPAHRVFCVLYTFPTQTGSRWRRVTRRQLAEALGKSEALISGALAELLASGLVDRKTPKGKPPGGRGQVASYRLPRVAMDSEGKSAAETREEWLALTGAKPSTFSTVSGGSKPSKPPTVSGLKRVGIPDPSKEKDKEKESSLPLPPQRGADKPRREESGKVGEAWKKFVDEAWPIIGRGAPAPALTPRRRKRVAEALDHYGEADLLATIPFLARVEFLRDEARLPADLAFRPEQIEAAGRLRAGGGATTPKRQLPAPPDGFTFPNGFRWSRLWGKPVPANEWKADPTRLKADPKAPPPPKDGDPLGPDSRWSTLWWRPLRMNEWTPDPNAGWPLALLEEFGVAPAGAGATIPDEGDPTPSGIEIGAQGADIGEGADAFPY